MGTADITAAPTPLPTREGLQQGVPSRTRVGHLSLRGSMPLPLCHLLLALLGAPIVAASLPKKKPAVT